MSNIFVICLAITAAGNGIGAVTWLVPGLTRLERFSFGTVAGVAVLSWAALLNSLLFGLDRVAIGLTTGLMVLAIPFLWKRIGLQKGWGTNDFVKAEVLRYGGWTLLFWAFFARVVSGGGDGIRTAPANNFGDLGFHLSVINSFAWGGNMPPQNPIFAGMSFTYPFLIDLLAAFFLRSGASLQVSLFIGNILLALAMIGVIESLATRLTGERLAGMLAPLLFVFSGGLGFMKLPGDLSSYLAETGGRVGDFLMNLPATYSINNSLHLIGREIPLRYGNLVTTMLIPQRSMLFGLPAVGMIITLWKMAFDEDCAPVRRREMFLAGCIAGLLPMMHAHGFFAVAIVCVPLALLWGIDRWRDWLAFLLPMVLLAGPQAFWLSQTKVRSALFKPHAWWEAGESNPILFWLANDGIFLLLLVVVFVILLRNGRTAAKFYMPFWLWLIVPNAALLAPWPWDNIKVLVYWSLVSSGLVALGVVALLRHRLVVVKVVGGLLLAGLILTGAIDLWRGLSPIENVPIFTAEDVRIAVRIRETTPPGSVILHAAIHNSPVALSGRRSLMGYPGHLWTHGIDYAERERDLGTIFAFGPEAPRLLARYGVSHVLIGPIEMIQHQADETVWLARYPVVFEEGGTRLFRIK